MFQSWTCGAQIKVILTLWTLPDVSDYLSMHYICIHFGHTARHTKRKAVFGFGSHALWIAGEYCKVTRATSMYFYMWGLIYANSPYLHKYVTFKSLDWAKTRPKKKECFLAVWNSYESKDPDKNITCRQLLIALGIDFANDYHFIF